MKYWLIRASLHETDIMAKPTGKVWDYEGIHLTEGLKGGDVVYLLGTSGDIYAWGFVSKVERYEDKNLTKSLMRVSIRFSEVRARLLPSEKIARSLELARPLSITDTNIVQLKKEEVERLNRLLHSASAELPPAPSEDDSSSTEISPLRRLGYDQAFVLNQPVNLEETRHSEFKEIKGGNPVDTIKNSADEYAVAFLNREGGSIYWGIRNNDRVVVGVSLDDSQKDDVRREVSTKLTQIQPRIPVSSFGIYLHAVLDERGQEISDLYVVEVAVPGGSPYELYATGSGEVYVKTDGTKQKLSFLHLTAEIMRRAELRNAKERGQNDPQQGTADPVIRIEFASLSNRRLLGDSIPLQAILHEPHNPGEIPDLNTNIHPANLLATQTWINTDYWRDIATYAIRHRAYKGIGVAAINTSERLAKNVRIEMECSHSAVSFLRAADMPDFPVREQSVLQIPRWQLAPPSSSVIEPVIRKHDDRWTITIEVGDIQPKATVWADKEFFVKAGVSGPCTLDVQVYADNISQPQRSRLSIDFSIESKPALTLDELKKIEDQHISEVYEQYRRERTES